MIIGTVFQANLNADKIIMDLKYLSDPINHTFWLTIRNQSLSTLYFKLGIDIPNWSIISPTDGNLGSIGASSTKTFTITISRTNPNTEIVESGNLIVEAYTDSGYTNKVGEAQLPITIYIEDLESWQDVEIYDFDDGTSQGWSLGSNMSIANDLSVEAGGYSARFYKSAGNFDTKTYLQKSITLPDRDKVRFSLFLAYYGNHDLCSMHHFSVSVNNEEIFSIPFTIFSGPGFFGWIKLATDLSQYKGQTVTLNISVWGKNERTWTQVVKIWFDRIVIAGKD